MVLKAMRVAMLANELDKNNDCQRYVKLKHEIARCVIEEGDWTYASAIIGLWTCEGCDVRGS